MAPRDNQAESMEPSLQRRKGVLEDRANGGVDTIASGCAVALAALAPEVPGALNPAYARKLELHKANLEHVPETGIIME